MKRKHKFTTCAACEGSKLRLAKSRMYGVWVECLNPACAAQGAREKKPADAIRVWNRQQKLARQR